MVAAGASVGTTSTPATQTASRTAQVKAVSTVSDGRDLSVIGVLAQPVERTPSAEAQERLYRDVLESAGDKPVVFRTVDIGGDKVLRIASSDGTFTFL